MKKHNCEECKRRKNYDKNPKSFSGRFWRWHINWCPGWKGYMSSLNVYERSKLKQKYGIN